MRNLVNANACRGAERSREESGKGKMSGEYELKKRLRGKANRSIASNLVLQIHSAY